MMYAASDVSHRADDTWTRIVWYARRRPYVAVAAVLSALTVLGLFISPGWGSYDQLPQEGADAGSKTDISPYVPPQLGDATTTIIPADDGGVLLSSSNVSTTTFASPNRAYTLKLRPDGDLVLTHNDDAGSHPVWSTGTGDNHAKGGHKVVFTTDVEGHTRMELRRKKKDEDWHIVWHSDLDPICKRTGVGEDGKHHKGSHDAHSTRQFVLSDNGTLRIAGLCNLYTPPSQQNKQRSLAVLVSGLYRTNNVTCYTQVKNLIQDHPSFKRVDVFARILYEDKDLTELNRTAESIEAEVKDCYGKYLKTVTVVPAAEAEEDYPGGSEAMLQPCGDKLRRLNNQLKTIDAAARDWWAWTVKQGFTHDTILRIRPDTLFHGSDKPMFLSLEDLRNSVILPHPKNEHYFYCPRMSGAVGVGTTDQLAYGTPAAMFGWLHMYRDFTQMVDLAANPDRPAHRDFSGCEDLPSGPAAKDCARPAPCSIECMVPWYLESRGIEFSPEWSWNQHLLRMRDILTDEDAIIAAKELTAERKKKENGGK